LRLRTLRKAAIERDTYAQRVRDNNLKCAGQFSRCVSALECAFRDRSTREAKAILEALQWVTFAQRPLEQQELSEALGTDLALDIRSKAFHSNVDKMQYGWEILHWCREILKIDENGLVDFHDTEMRIFILSPEFEQITGLHTVDAHEMIATVCVKHLQCESAKTILKSWLSTGRWVRSRKLKCHLQSYSITFWPDHYRIAQHSSRNLSAMIHQAIIAAVSASVEEEFACGPKSKTKMNIGLAICSKYDFYILGQMYLEMGADIDGGAYSVTQPLILAVMNKSFRMITILLDSGANPSLPDRDGITALGYAYDNGDLATINTLIQHWTELETRKCLTASMGQRAGDDDCTPSLLDTRHQQTKGDSLPPVTVSPSDLPHPSNNTTALYCQSSALPPTYMVDDHCNSTKNDEIGEAIRNLEMFSLLDAHMRYSPNENKMQHVEPDSWLLVGFEDLSTSVT
jgi:hypothetical protein